MHLDDKRLFAVYDQIVPRMREIDKAPITSHVGIFATVIPKGPVPKDQPPPKQVKKDIARKIYDLFMEGHVALVEFRGNLFEDLNQKARERSFEIPNDEPPA